MNLNYKSKEFKKILNENLTKSHNSNIIHIHLLNNKTKLKTIDLFNINFNFNQNIISLISSYYECDHKFDIIKHYCNLNLNSEISIKKNYYNLENLNNSIQTNLGYTFCDNLPKIKNYETINLSNLIQDNLLITYNQHNINSSTILKKNCDIYHYLTYEWSLDNLIKLKLTIHLNDNNTNAINETNATNATNATNKNNTGTRNTINENTKFDIKLIIKKKNSQIVNNIQINKIMNYLIKLNKLISYLDIK